MNAPKVPTVKMPKILSNVNWSKGMKKQSPIGNPQSAVGSPGGPLKDNPELILKPSKTNPAVKRWQKATEEQPEPKEKKVVQEPEKKAKAETEEGSAFQIGDRIAFQTKQQKGSVDFTFGKIQEESDTFYGVVGDDGETYSLLKQQAKPVNEAHRVIDAEQRQAKREGREPRTAEGMRSREVKIKAGAGYQPGILTEKGELWQMVNVGSYIDYVKLGVLNENAIVGLKIGQMLGVTKQDGEHDVIHRSDVTRVGEGANSQAIEKYMKKMESHLNRLEKRIAELQLDNKSLREFVRKKAEDKGISSKEQERLNKEIVKYKQKSDALVEKINAMALRNAEKERKRLEALYLSLKKRKRRKKPI